MKPIRTWVVISDGDCARILSHAGPGRTLKAVPGLSFPCESHHVVTDRRNPADAARLAAVVAKALDDQFGAFDRLVIVAPADVRDLLRKAMAQRVERRVYREIVLNLTRTPNSKVASYLHEVLAA